MSIKVENITKLYGKQKALDNVSFEVKAGEVVGFLGPNGAGKSTMMKILTCYIPQTSGAASVCGFDVTEQTHEVKKRTGYLPENNPLYMEMYVREYLTFISGIYKLNGNKNQRIDEIISMVGLGDEQKKKIGALSKGYRQRVGLAQALIHNPEVLILDEPTSGLDPNQLAEVRLLIKNIGKEKTVILSTHIMQEVEAICGRVIIINKGKIVADDTTGLLQQKSQSGNIVVVEFASAVAKEELKKISGVNSVENISGNTWKLTAAQDKDIRNDVFRFAVEKDISVLSLQKSSQNLEGIFRELTQ
jgi:ABC-2 type transport system ATP-binding protein